MTFLVLSGATPIAAPSGGTPKQGAGETAGFDLLIQGESLPNALTILPEPAGVPLSDAGIPEDINPETAEGLMALLDYTIARLEAEHAPITPKKLLAALSSALGVAQVDDIGELAVGIQGEGDALKVALQERLAIAVRPVPHISQSSAASVAVPGEGQLKTGSVDPEQLGTPLTGKWSKIASAGVAITTAPGQTAAVAETAMREPQSFGAQVQLPQEMVRVTPAPLLASSVPVSTTPDDQLRQHVSHQIRTAEIGDSKFRFSLTPHGLGEIEIEVLRSETGRVKIAMSTESASVLNVLRHDRDLLLDALQSRGIRTDNADLDFQTFGERDRRGNQQPDTSPHLLQADAESIDAENSPPVRSVIGSGTLDLLT